MQKEGIGVIYLQTYKQNNIMPKVGKKEFEYDEEGMAAAEEEAAKKGEDMRSADDSFVVAIERAVMKPAEQETDEGMEEDMKETDEGMEEDMKEMDEGMEEDMKEMDEGMEEMVMSLFMELFGEEFDENNEEHQMQMQMISELMQKNPEATPAQLITMFMRENVENI